METANAVQYRIPVFRPFSGEAEIEAVAAVIRSGWWGSGKVTAQLESEFAAYVGAKHAVATNSATAALHLALIVAGVGPGDEVITTPLTFVSTNHAILYVGATPVFADVDAETLCIDPGDVKRKITAKTKAIMVVDYAGHPAELGRLNALARTHNLVVIEDAAHAAGARFRQHAIGSVSPLTTFSFHPVKNLASPDGGMVTTDNDAWAARLRKLRWLGIDRDTWSRVGSTPSEYAWQYDVDEVGFKYNPNDIMAAIAREQLKRLDRTNAMRAAIAERYDSGLEALDWLQLPTVQAGMSPSWHAYVVRCERRDDLATHLRERGIATGMHYVPNHLHAVYTPYRTPLPVVEREWLRLLTLPLFPAMRDEEVEYVIEAIHAFRI